MISLKLKYLPTRIKGRKGSLCYQVVNGKEVGQIDTPYRIFPSEWDSQKCLIRTASPSARANYLESVKRNIRYDMECIHNIINMLCASPSSFTAKTIVREYRKRSVRRTFFGYMERMVVLYCEQGKSRTSETFLTTLNSFRRFRSDVDISLEDVDAELMQSYASWLKHCGLSPNTVTFYLKRLRAAYNRAVDENHLPDNRPFRWVPTSIERTPKRAVSLQLIKRLKALELGDSPSKQFAKDMFLFSFYTRGMSFVDIAYLEKKNLNGNVLSYRRKKTNQLLHLYWESCMQDILKRYAADSSSPYLFSIIKQSAHNPRAQYKRAFFRVNRNLKEIGKSLGLSESLTLYCARHSWASIARSSGVPLSVISEGMGHDSEKTTQIYLTSLKTEVIDKANRKILSLL